MKHILFRTYLVSAVFICSIAFPFLNDRSNFVSDLPNLENRRLAEKPVFDVAHLDRFPQGFEKYYNDTFALRSRIMSCFNIYNTVLLQKSPFPDKIVIGNKGWLYLAQNNIDCYLGKNQLTNAELAAFKNVFDSRQKYLAAKKCKVYFAITPVKASVYPENVPFTFYREDTQTWGEKLNDFIDANSTIKMIDLFGLFKKIKSEEFLYYKTDNHWNSLGAFEAANKVIDQISVDFPGLKPLQLSDYLVTRSQRDIGNLKQMLGNLDLYSDVEYELTPKLGFKAVAVPIENYPVPQGFAYPSEYEREKEIKNSTAPRMLIFTDSFGGYFFPFFSEHFSRTVMIFGGWSYLLDKDIVEKEKPDIVLFMIHEPLVRVLLEK